MPAISVIVPVYKVEKYLDRCIESILNQTFKDFEVILVDDGSPDRCPAMCDEWAKKDSRIRVIHKENGGLSSARNAGLKIQKGEFVCFVDSDDWILPEMLQDMFELLDAYKDCDIAECEKVDCTSENARIIQPEFKPEVYDKRKMLEYFFRVNGEPSNTQVWNKLIRREVLRDFEFVDTLNEDVEASYEFFMRAKKMVRTNRVYYCYYKNNYGITRSKFSEKDLEYLDVWKRIVQRTMLEIPEYSRYAEIGLKRAYFTLLAKMFFRGYDRNDEKMLEVKKQLKKSVRSNFMELWKWKMPLNRKVLLVFLCLV